MPTNTTWFDYFLPFFCTPVPDMFSVSKPFMKRAMIIEPFCLLLLPSPSSPFSCSDDLYRDCPGRATRGDCEGGDGVLEEVVRMMLAECRRSCQRRWQDRPLPWAITKYGGLEDTITDPFGFHYPLCGAESKLTADGRDSLLFQVALYHEQPKWIPSFSKVGFQKVDIPAGLWAKLSKAYLQARERLLPEDCISGLLNYQEVQDDGQESSLVLVQRTFLIHLEPEVMNQVTDTLWPMAETWSGTPLEHSATYGVRRYTNTSRLSAHLDRLGSHVISVIMNLGQEVEEDWPLYIQDHSGGLHRVVLAAGEMVWYEGARLSHGRMTPLSGEFYDNLFVHYKPRGLWYKSQYKIGRRPRDAGPLTKEDIKTTEENEKIR